MCYEKTSIVIEFYGLKIPIEDSKKLSYVINNLSNILDNLSESDKLNMSLSRRFRSYNEPRIWPIENELSKILDTIDIHDNMLLE